ncbi:GNAT family N-acetyltransferase [Lentzea sp. NPDC092896]|uniref:GNAT family N-acetyltransferase n=1 Tax=Lentzea sp. NPDC092896 TaxID=3364127 RepID=UPI0038257EB0
MGVTVETLDLTQAPDDDLRAAYDILAAWRRVTTPEDEPLDFATWLKKKRIPDVHWGQARYLVARQDGQTVGVLEGFVPEVHNAGHAAGLVVVDPRWRNQGIGTALFQAGAREAAADVLEAGWIPQHSEGERWALARGFRAVNAMTRQQLVLTDPLPDPGEIPAGYRVVRWEGRTPEEFVGAYADALNAFKDAPFGDSTLVQPHYTPESLRQEEAAFAAGGTDMWVVLVLHGDEPAGVTVLHRQPSRPALGDQRHTVVLPAHRGKGLGRLIKAIMLRDLPGVERITTTTSSTNEHMLRVNHSLGFTDQSTTVDLSARVADLNL